MNGAEDEKGNHPLGEQSHWQKHKGDQQLLGMFWGLEYFSLYWTQFSLGCQCVPTHIHILLHTSGPIALFLRNASPSYLLPIEQGKSWETNEPIPSSFSTGNLPECAYLGSPTFLMSQNGFINSHLTPQCDVLHLLIGVCMTCHCTECSSNWGTECSLWVNDKW